MTHTVRSDRHPAPLAAGAAPRAARLVLPVFFLSGVAGLGYEIVWTRLFAVGLGHELPSVLAVVAAFFGGFALGAWGLDRVVSRSRTPGRWYVGLEIAIGGWAIATAFLIAPVNRLAAEMIGVDPSPVRHGLVALAAPLLTLLPATVAMGATLPAMERLVARLRGSGRTIAGVYAVNTAGAMAGTLLATFVLMPAVGFRTTLFALAAVNFLCAAAIALGPAAGEAVRAPIDHHLTDPPGALRLGTTILLTGLLGIGYEVLCVRVMAQVLENTVYSFASALSVYLFGTAVGAALYQRFARKESFDVPLVWLLQWIALGCLVGTLILSGSGTIYEHCRLWLGGGMFGSIAAEIVLALLVFLAPTIAMGATFGHLVQAARRGWGGVGRALGLNTLGASLAPIVFGIVLLPLGGAKAALVVVALGYLPLVPLHAIRPHRLVPALLALFVAVALPARLVLVDAPPGSRIVEYREGVMAAVAVTEDAEGGRLLKVNNRFFMGGTIRSFADRRQAHIPLLLHPAPRHALFLGLGSGITAGAATEHAGLEVTGAELVPEVVELLPAFAPANRLARLEGRLVIADARRFVRATDETYDVIVADLFHPGRDGAGALYTREHFEAVRGRLKDRGLFCQWLPVYQLDLDTLRLIMRTFLDVFPVCRAYLAHQNISTPMLGLIGENTATRYPADWFARRVGGDEPLARALRELGLDGELPLFGCIVAGDADLRAFAGDGPLNTDDHPRVIFQAPGITYRKDEPARIRLRALLESSAPAAAELLDAEAAGGELGERLNRYLAARDLYLRGAFERVEGRGPAALELFLLSVRRSADFRPAYATCLQEAIDLARSDPAAARRILRALREANPSDPRADRLLSELGER